MIHALAYVSNTSRELGSIELRSILDKAVSFNRVAGVTGILLYDGSRFFQYLEGPADGVSAALGRIENSRLHGGVRILFSREIKKRAIPYWSMRVFPEEMADIDALVAADWSESNEEASMLHAADGFLQMAELLALHERAG